MPSYTKHVLKTLTLHQCDVAASLCKQPSGSWPRHRQCSLTRAAPRQLPLSCFTGAGTLSLCTHVRIVSACLGSFQETLCTAPVKTCGSSCGWERKRTPRSCAASRTEEDESCCPNCHCLTVVRTTHTQTHTHGIMH